MAVPFRSLAVDRPSVLPAAGTALGQFTQNLYAGFGGGQARAQEDELPELIRLASETFGSAELGNLVDVPAPGAPLRPWDATESALLAKMLRHPGTRDWAQQLLAIGPRGDVVE